MSIQPEHGELVIRKFVHGDEDAVVALWEAAGLTRPWNDPRKDIARKLMVQGEWFLVAASRGEVIGSVMAGYDGHRGWVNYLAVSPNARRAGIGRALMNEVELRLRDAGCPKINLQVRETNQEALGFYQALGYSTDDVVSLGRRLEPDHPATES
jgi:ribosomal protein S18 acetylase RimI-like enzyme